MILQDAISIFKHILLMSDMTSWCQTPHFVQNGVKSQTGYQQITVAEVGLTNSRKPHPVMILQGAISILKHILLMFDMTR